MIFLPLLSGFVYLLLQAWITRGWWRIRPGTETIQPPISVIVAARNEADRLPALLRLLLGQRYPDFEVIVVLDRCSDESESIVRSLAAQDERLRYLQIETLPEDWAGKKWALDGGIRMARNEHLAFTDADCVMTEHWLREIARHFDEQTEVLLGIGAYGRAPGWLNRFIRFETFYAAFQYIGMAQNGIPYMGVGRNLAYRKSFFERHGGFGAFRERLSGDDDLLVNAYARGSHTRTLISAESRTLSEAKTRFIDWLSQKKRHLSAANRYTLRTRTILGLFHLSHLFFYAGILLSLGFAPTAWLPFSLYVTRLGLSAALFASLNNKLDFRGLMAYYPILDLLFFVYNLSVVPAGIMMKPEWKK
jgi:cellulose synthase/poly-beta-1,6-N-acetylglucosamine synthase-like glycosyltransferase